jgi:methionine-rich copper-binding protein CopC
MKTTRLTTGLFGLLLLLAWPLVSSAHTHMEKSSPAKGAQLTAAPKSVELWFSSKVAAEWSTIKVTDSGGKQVDKGEVSSGDDPDHLSVDLQALPAGHYDVHWNAISGDGHRVKGSFSFEVK